MPVRQMTFISSRKGRFRQIRLAVLMWHVTYLVFGTRVVDLCAHTHFRSWLRSKCVWTIIFVFIYLCLYEYYLVFIKIPFSKIVYTRTSQLTNVLTVLSHEHSTLSSDSNAASPRVWNCLPASLRAQDLNYDQFTSSTRWKHFRLIRPRHHVLLPCALPTYLINYLLYII